MPEVYYRAYMEPTAEFFNFPADDNYTINFMEIKVLSHTPCGVWLDYWTAKNKKKFVNNNNKKRFAYPTKEEARESLGFRLRSYESHLKIKYDDVQMQIAAYNKEMETLK